MMDGVKIVARQAGWFVDDVDSNYNTTEKERKKSTHKQRNEETNERRKNKSTMTLLPPLPFLVPSRHRNSTSSVPVG